MIQWDREKEDEDLVWWKLMKFSEEGIYTAVWNIQEQSEQLFVYIYIVWWNLGCDVCSMSRKKQMR